MDFSPNTTADPGPVITVRGVRPGEGKTLWRLAATSETLETNTTYAYGLLARDFSETCLLAEADGDPVGYVAAYRPPTRSDVVFVWQIGVAKSARGRGLAKRLLHALVERPGCRGVRHLESTVTPSNAASDRLFRSFARERGAPVEVLSGFAAEELGDGDHEREDLYRVGPLPVVATTNERNDTKR